MLDEIYAVEWAGGRWRFKSSFGTALKLWGDSAWGNFSTYCEAGGRRRADSQRADDHGPLRATVADRGEQRGAARAAAAAAERRRTQPLPRRSAARPPCAVDPAGWATSATPHHGASAGDERPTARSTTRPGASGSGSGSSRMGKDEPGIRVGSASPESSTLTPDSLTPDFSLFALICSAESITSVTGPSLTSSTSMCARNRPVATRTPCPRLGDELLVNPLGLLRRRRGDEARPAAFAAIAQQRELAHHEQLAADVGQREIHLAVGVLEDRAGRRLCRPATRRSSSSSSAATPSSTSNPRPISPTVSPSTTTRGAHALDAGPHSETPALMVLWSLLRYHGCTNIAACSILRR